MNLTDDQQPLWSSQMESVKIAGEKASAADITMHIEPPPPAHSGTISIWNSSPRIIWLREVFLRFGSISFATGCSCSSGTSKLHRQHQLQYVSPFPLGDSPYGGILLIPMRFMFEMFHFEVFGAFARRGVQVCQNLHHNQQLNLLC